MAERIWFELYQSCGNRMSVGRVSLFGLRWCRWGVGKALGPGCGGAVLRLCDFTSPGFVLTSSAFMRSSANHPADLHGRLAQKTVNRVPIAGAGDFDTICTVVCIRCDSSTACRVCRLEPS